jgi:two-component sensor histidine kinase
MNGPEIKISGGAAESFAMMVHELTINSIKHGVLGDAQGKLEVRWAFCSDSADDGIVFEWVETGRQLAANVKRQGFGSMVLGADGSPLVGHSSRMELRDDGLRYSLRLSSKEVRA